MFPGIESPPIRDRDPHAARSPIRCLLFYEATVEDPVMFTEPWVVTPRHLVLGGPDEELFETFCVSQDKEHIIKPTNQDSFTCNYRKKPSH